MLSDEGINSTAAWMITLSAKDLGEFMVLMVNWRQKFQTEVMEAYSGLRRAHDRNILEPHAGEVF